MPLIEAANTFVGVEKLPELQRVSLENFVLTLVCHLKLRVVERAKVCKLEAEMLELCP